MGCILLPHSLNYKLVKKLIQFNLKGCPRALFKLINMEIIAILFVLLCGAIMIAVNIKINRYLVRRSIKAQRFVTHAIIITTILAYWTAFQSWATNSLMCIIAFVQAFSIPIIGLIIQYKDLKKTKPPTTPMSQDEYFDKNNYHP